MQRRRSLLATAALAAVGLAGCTGGGPGSPGDGNGNGDGDGPTDTPPSDGGGGSPGGVDTSFEVVAANCGAQANEAEVAFGDESVTVEGTTWGSDACYTARLESATRDGRTLTVQVVAESTADDDESCAQCISEIEYRLTVETPSTPETVVVVHDGETVTRVTP